MYYIKEINTTWRKNQSPPWFPLSSRARLYSSEPQRHLQCRGALIHYQSTITKQHTPGRTADKMNPVQKSVISPQMCRASFYIIASGSSNSCCGFQAQSFLGSYSHQQAIVPLLRSGEPSRPHKVFCRGSVPQYQRWAPLAPIKDCCMGSDLSSQFWDWSKLPLKTNLKETKSLTYLI